MVCHDRSTIFEAEKRPFLWLLLLMFINADEQASYGFAKYVLHKVFLAWF